jgi:hypothetical protein
MKKGIKVLKVSIYLLAFLFSTSVLFHVFTVEIVRNLSVFVRYCRKITNFLYY